jgi:nucleoid DNA-binding protein
MSEANSNYERTRQQNCSEHLGKTTFVKTVVQNFLNEILFELSTNNRIEFRDSGILETKARKSR